MNHYVGELLSLCDSGDNEGAHGTADGLILQALSDLGFAPIADAWEKVAEMGFWYA